MGLEGRTETCSNLISLLSHVHGLCGKACLTLKPLELQLMVHTSLTVQFYRLPVREFMFRRPLVSRLDLPKKNLKSRPRNA